MNHLPTVRVLVLSLSPVLISAPTWTGTVGLVHKHGCDQLCQSHVCTIGPRTLGTVQVRLHTRRGSRYTRSIHTVPCKPQVRTVLTRLGRLLLSVFAAECRKSLQTAPHRIAPHRNALSLLRPHLCQEHIIVRPAQTPANDHDDYAATAAPDMSLTNRCHCSSPCATQSSVTSCPAQTPHTHTHTLTHTHPSTHTHPPNPSPSALAFPRPLHSSWEHKSPTQTMPCYDNKHCSYRTLLPCSLCP